MSFTAGDSPPPAGAAAVAAPAAAANGQQPNRRGPPRRAKAARGAASSGAESDAEYAIGEGAIDNGLGAGEEPNVAPGKSETATPKTESSSAKGSSPAAAPDTVIDMAGVPPPRHEERRSRLSPASIVGALRKSPASAAGSPGAVAGRLAAVRASAVGLRPPRNAAAVRLIGAPTIDIAEAKRQMLADSDSGVALDNPPAVAAAADSGAAGAGADQADDAHAGDVLDTANEETFTLETFEALIRTARAAEKTFLLARVTTVDPRDAGRLYYSYYSAYQINKVIFRTQPEEGLLHRMKSRNPLNNMLIVGDVHYFAVTPEEFDRAWAAAVPGCDDAAASVVSLAAGAPVVYEAKFFATDDDFLMRTDIREFFRRNSVAPDDYQLFQLHRRSEHAGYEMAVLGPDGRPVLDGTQPAADGGRPSRLRTLCGLLDAGAHRSLVGLPTGFLAPLGFWVLMLLATAAVVVVGLLVLPAPTQYFAFGGLAAFFVLVLLLFVDWTDGRRRA